MFCEEPAEKQFLELSQACLRETSVLCMIFSLNKL